MSMLQGVTDAVNTVLRSCPDCQHRLPALVEGTLHSGSFWSDMSPMSIPAKNPKLGRNNRLSFVNPLFGFRFPLFGFKLMSMRLFSLDTQLNKRDARQQ